MGATIIVVAVIECSYRLEQDNYRVIDPCVSWIHYRTDAHSKVSTCELCNQLGQQSVLAIWDWKTPVSHRGSLQLLPSQRNSGDCVMSVGMCGNRH